jgi:hypothetical protein
MWQNSADPTGTGSETLHIIYKAKNVIPQRQLASGFAPISAINI